MVDSKCAHAQPLGWSLQTLWRKQLQFFFFHVWNAPRGQIAENSPVVPQHKKNPGDCLHRYFNSASIEDIWRRSREEKKESRRRKSGKSGKSNLRGSEVHAEVRKNDWGLVKKRRRSVARKVSARLVWDPTAFASVRLFYSRRLDSAETRLAWRGFV